jgi:hypothetical protein
MPLASMAEIPSDISLVSCSSGYQSTRSFARSFTSAGALTCPRITTTARGIAPALDGAHGADAAQKRRRDAERTWARVDEAARRRESGGARRRLVSSSS